MGIKKAAISIEITAFAEYKTPSESILSEGVSTVNICLNVCLSAMPGTYPYAIGHCYNSNHFILSDIFNNRKNSSAATNAKDIGITNLFDISTFAVGEPM